MVQKKIKICFVYPDGDGWTGEVNYLNSLITSLKLIKSRNLGFSIFCSEKRKKLLISNINSKNLISSDFFGNLTLKSFLRKLIKKIFNEDLVLNYFIKKYKIDIISHHEPLKIIPSLCWIPDFQHIYYKKFFSKKEYDRREKLFHNYINNSKSIIVSSKDSYSTLIKKYKKKTNIYVLNFVPFVEFNKIKKFNYIKHKYKINSHYIYVPNQFWKHKNHLILIEAAKILRKKNFKFKFVISGSSSNEETKKNYNIFSSKIEESNLGNFFINLGFIPYRDVINLIFHCDILINPSLFEGWSTTVEEAKLFDKKMILSDIKVHNDQAVKNTLFFNPFKPKELADKICVLSEKKLKKTKFKILKKSYIRQRDLFAKKYFEIIKKSM